MEDQHAPIPRLYTAMSETQPVSRRLDLTSLEMIFAVALITLHDFLLSNALSLPFAIQHSTLVQWRTFDRLVSGLEFLVPTVVFAIMFILWLLRLNTWVQHTAV